MNITLYVLGIGVVVIFLILGFMVYLFLTCTRTEKAATSSNILIRSEPGSSASVTTAAPAPATAPATATPTLVYYPVQGPVRRRRQVRAGAGESRALAAGCLLPLLGLVLTSLVCFITVIIILCSMSYFINK